MILSAISHRFGRAVLGFLVVTTLGASAVEGLHAANCDVGDGCDCCNQLFCPGQHSSVCPSGHHNCQHHIGTSCNWPVEP